MLARCLGAGQRSGVLRFACKRSWRALCAWVGHGLCFPFPLPGPQHPGSLLSPFHWVVVQSGLRSVPPGRKPCVHTRAVLGWESLKPHGKLQGGLRC